MTIAALLAVVVVLALLFEWWGRKPIIHRGIEVSELPSFFGTLLERGFEGGMMFVQPEDVAEGEPFLQFTKYGTDAQPGLRFAFPDAPWSKSVFSRVIDELSARGYPVIMEETGEPPVQRFAIVTLGRGLHQASDVAATALSVMGHEGRLKIWYKGVGPGPLRSAQGQRTEKSS